MTRAYRGAKRPSLIKKACPKQPSETLFSTRSCAFTLRTLLQDIGGIACWGLFLCLVLGLACNVRWAIEKDYKSTDVMAVDSLLSAGRRIDLLASVRSDHSLHDLSRCPTNFYLSLAVCLRFVCPEWRPPCACVKIRFACKYAHIPPLVVLPQEESKKMLLSLVKSSKISYTWLFKPRFLL